MKNRISILIPGRVLLLLPLLLIGSMLVQRSNAQGASQMLPAKTMSSEQVNQLIGNSQNGITFTENKGQWPTQVLYRADVPGGQMLATPQGMLIGVFDPGSVAAISDYNMKVEQMEARKLQGGSVKDLGPAPALKGHGWRLNFLGGSIASPQSIDKQGESQDISNYFSGDPSTYAAGVHGYGILTYKDVYQGINVKYYTAKDGSLENDIVVKPGADASKINMQVEGIEQLRINSNGALILPTSVGNISIPHPVSYLVDANGQRTEINVKYHLIGKNTISFDIPAYDKGLTLVIDPIVMRWASWISSTSNVDSHCHGIDLDASGNIYVVGKYGTGLITVGAFQTTNPGNTDDLFISEYQEPATPGGSGTRVWQTYLGGSNGCNPYAVNVSADGYLYIVGITSDNLATTYGTGAPTPKWTQRDVVNSGQQVFVAKVITTGAWAEVRQIGDSIHNLSPYLFDVRLLPTGSSTYDLEAVGYVSVQATSSRDGDIPIPTYPNGTAATIASTDTLGGYALRISSDLNTIKWTKEYTSGSGINQFAISNFDNAGHILIGGLTDGSSNISYNNPSSQTTKGGKQDGWLLALDTADGTCAWSRYFQSASTKSSSILCMELNQEATKFIIGGMTGGLATANTTSGAYAQTYPGSTGQDFYIASLPVSGASTTWGTYFGGNGSNTSDNMMGLNIDQNDDVYVLGYTNSKFVPTTIPANGNPIQTDTYDASDYDAIFFKLSGTTGDTLLYYTFLGGKGDEEDPIGERGIKFNECRIYLAITSRSNDFPLTTGSVDSVYSPTQNSRYLPLIVSMANPPDLLDNGITGGGNQTITCGQTPAQITAGVPSYIIPEIIRNKLPQTDSTTGAYPNGLPRITSYQWQSSINNGASWTTISGATGQNYTPVIVDSFVGTIEFRRIIDNDACNRAGDTLAIAKVIVTPPYAAPAITTNTPVCLGDTIDLATPAQSGYTYAWSGPNGFTSTLQNPKIPNASAIDTGFYKLTVKNTTNGCPSYPDSADVGVSSVGLPTPTANASPNPVCSGGTLTLTATNVTAGATYTWTGPGYSESSTTNPVTINPVSTANAGSYTVVQSSGGCKSSSSAAVIVVVNASPSITSTSSVNPSTCGGSNGSITLNGLAADSTFLVSYTFNGSGTPTTLNLTANASGQIVITNLGAGAYTNITVSIHTCTSSPVAGTITLNAPTTPGSPIVSSNTPVCSGDTIKLFATGQGGATYSWTSNPTGYTSGLQDPVIANATTGEGISYCATQTVAGCTSTAACTPVTVNPTPAITAAAGVNPTTCNGTNGTITLSGLNNTQTYAVTYSRDGIGQGSSNLTSNGSGQIIITGLDSGVYTHFVVTTQALCPSAAYAGPVVLTNPATPAAPGVSSNTPVCQGDTIKLFATGTGGATYAWTSSPTGFSSSSQNPIITNATLAEGISYCATQTVANCISPQACTPVVVNTTPVITNSSSTSPDSCGGFEGTITLLGLTASQTYSVTYEKNSSPVSIPSITANISGRIVITGLGAGTYTDFVVTLNGCPSAPLAGTIVLSDPTIPQAPSVQTNTPVCQGDTIYLSATGANGASFSWTSNPTGFTSTIADPFIANASVGSVNYCVTQSVANCVSLQTCQEVTVNPRPVITSVIGSNPTSCGGNQGSITINGLTSSLSYTVTYLFNSVAQGPLPFTANGSGQIIISGLVVGTYSNIVVTLNGCSSNSAGPVTLVNPTGPNTPIATTDAPVCAGSSLTLGVNTTNGATYRWSGPLNYNAFTSSTTVSNSAQPNMSGTYKVVVSLNNCQDSSTINATVNYNPVVNTGNGGAYCANSGGSVTLGGSPTVTDQSNGSFTYAWSPRTGLNDSTSSNPVATPTSSTTYDLTVTDGNHCSATGTASVTVNPLPTAFAGDDTAVCSGQSVQLGGNPAATGGTPGSGYSYTWNNGAANTSNPTVTPLSTTTYTLTVTDSKTCTATASQVVTVNPNPSANAGSPKSIAACSLVGTQIGGNPTASQGTSPYTFLWSPASGLTNDTTADPTVVGIGSSQPYSVLVTDFNGCTATSSVLVTVDSSNLSVTISANGASTWCSASNGSITFTAIPSGGTPGYSYLWTGPALSSDTLATTTANPNTGGTYNYSVIVTDKTGCQTGTSTSITVNPSPTANAGPLDTVCSGVTVNLGFNPTASGGTGPNYTYQWSGGASGVANPSVTLTNSSPVPTTTTYNLTVTDELNCTATATTSVTVNPNPSANAGPDHTVASCARSFPRLGGNPTASGGVGPYTFVWSPDAGLNNDTDSNPVVVSVGQSTDFTLTVTDANGCTASSSTALNVVGTSLSVVFVENTSLFWCAGTGGTVTFTALATGGSTPYTYQWFGTDLSVDTGFFTTANPDQPGTYLYSVIVTDSTGCQAGNTVPVQVFISPVASAGDSSYTVCNGQSVILGGNPTANSGTTPYRYAWSGGASAVANPSVSPALTTTYTLLVTDSNNCTATASTTVNVNQLPTASAGPNVTLPSCSPTGISIGGTPTAKNGTPGYTYSWTPNIDLSSNTVSNPTVVGLTADTSYTVVVTDTNGCSNSAEVSVTVTNNSPLVSVSPATSHYCTGSGTTTTLTAVVTGGSPTFSYSWAGSGVTPNNSSVASADPNLPGIYSYAVTVTDQFNCTTSATTTITVNPNPAANAGIPDTICNGKSATLGSDSTASGGTGPYIYAWSGGAQSIANPSVSPSTNTQYNVVVTDSNGCTAASGVTVVVNQNPVANAGGPNITLPACSPTGVQIGGTPSASGGMPPYIYAWSPDVDLSFDSIANPTVAGLTSDTLYTLVVTDNNGCSASAEVSVNVTNNPPLVSISANGHNHWCANTGDHVDLTATVNGGSGTFTYSWSGSFINPTNASLVTVNPNTPGSYTYYVTVTDGYNCSATDSFNIIIYPNPTADAGGPFTICNGNSVQIGNNPTASGGTGSYLYAWSGGASPIANPNVNPGTTTTYTVVVTDQAGCTAVSSSTVTVSPTPKADAGPDQSVYACSGGRVIIGGSPSASGGSGSYTYSWSPSTGLSDSSVSNPIVSGIDSTITYTLVVTDSTGCTATDQVTVRIIPSTLQATAGISKQICSGPNSCVQIGGTPTAQGGVPPYSYNWSNNGTLTPPFNADPLACPLNTTTYALTVSDAIGCLAYDSVTVTVNPSPVANAGNDTSICLGQSVVIGGSPSGTGGTGTLTYLWDSPFGLSSQDSSNPTATPIITLTYGLLVTDAKGCTGTSDVTVTVRPTPTASAYPGASPTLAACSPTGIKIGGSPTASGGTPGYTYLWSPAIGLVTPTSANPTVAGITVDTTYTVVVTDTTGCTASAQVSVNVTNNPPVASISGSGPLHWCVGSDGSVNLTAVVTGGAPTFNYNWSGSFFTPFNSSEGLANPDTAGTYTYDVTVTDAFNCTSSATTTITVNPNPVASAGPNDTICDLSSVEIGGNPTATLGGGSYTYKWSNNSTASNPTVSPTATRIYTVTVTDINACSATSSTTVTVHPNPTANAGQNQTLVACSSDSVQIGGHPSATGGTGPYTYQWSPPFGLYAPDSSNPWVKNLSTSAVYILTVTDSYGCTGSSGVAVTVTGSSIQVNAGNNASYCFGSNVSITLGGNPTVTGASGKITYIWTPTNGLSDSTSANPNASPTVTTTYYLQVIDANGCVGQDSVRITVNQLPTVNAGKNDTVCAGGCVLLGGSPTATGGAGGYTYTWSPGSYLSSTDTSNPVACPTLGFASNVFYRVTVTDSLGCSNTGSVSLTASNLQVSVGLNQTICAGNTAQLTANVTGGTAGYTVSWSPDSGFITSNTILTPIVKPSVTTTYYLTIGDSLGCNAIDSVTIFVNPAIKMGVLSTKTVCANSGGVILGGHPTASGGTIPFSYIWSGGPVSGGTTANPVVTSPTTTTTYCVTVTDHAGCSASACQTVIVNPAVTACAGPPNLSMTNCVGSTLTLGCTPTGNGGSNEFTYQWAPDSVAGVQVLNNDTTSNPVVHGLIQNTIFTVTVTDLITGCSATASVGVTVNQSSLVANAGPNVSTCGSNINCITIGGQPTASGGVPPYTYNWIPPRPIIGQNQLPNPCVSPQNLPSPLTTFHVTVTDHLGCTAVDSMNFYVSPAITAFAGDDTTICAGQSVPLGGNPTGTGGTGTLTYLWQPSINLNPGANVSNPTAQNITTNVTYTVTVFDSLGCNANSSINILTRCLPQANAGPDFSIFPCSHDSIVLQGSASSACGDGPPFTYLWGPPLNFCLTCQTPTVDSVGATTQFYLVVTDSFGCQSPRSYQTTTVLPKTLFVSAGGASAICAASGSCVTLDGTAAGGVPGYTFQWSGGTFIPDSLVFDPQVCPVKTTTYTLVVTDSKGCQAADTVQVTVQPQPVVFITGLNAKYCVGAGNVIMTGVPAGGTFSGPGVTGNVFQPSVIGVGTYNIQYSYTNPVTHCSGDTVVSVTVNPLPTVGISGYANSYCRSASCVNLIGTPAGGTWSGAGVSPAGLFCPATGNSTTDTIGYTYTNPVTGCSNTAQAIITISPSPTLSISVASDTVCAGNSVTLFPTYSLGVNNVIWTQLGGSTIGAGAGSFTFTPTGTSYCVVGTAVNSNTACSVNDTICFSITQPPVANPVFANTCQGQSVIIPVAQNVVPFGSYTITISPTAHGTATLVNDTIHYTASATDTASTDTIYYKACSISCPGNCSSSFAVVSICHVAKPPVIVNVIDTIYENTTAYVCPPISDPNGYPLVVTPNYCGSLTNGTVQQTTDSCFTFIPNHDWIGTEVICVVVCNNHGLCDTGKVTIVVLPANQAPIAGLINLDVCAGTTVGINVASATTDPEGNPVTITYGLLTGPGAANWQVTGAGSANFESGTPGQYIMPYTICNQSPYPVHSLCASNYIVINVVNCNVNPNDSIQANNDYVVTNINTRDVINELANDYYPSAADLTVTVLVGPHLAGASWSLNSNGTINYSSPSVGYDSIVYQICDPAPLCSTATIYIYVDSSGVTHYPPVAVDDFDTTDYLTPINLLVLSNDYSPDGNPFTITALPCSPLKGTDSISNNGTSITYTPGAHATSLSPDTFCYKICDVGFPTLCDTATVVVFIRGSVVAVNDTAETGQHQCIDINVLANDYDPQGFNFGIVGLLTGNTVGSASIDTINGKQIVHFCPKSDSCGFVDKFQYVIEDAAGATDTATVYVTIDCCPEPVAVNDSVIMLPGASATIYPFANDKNISSDIIGGVLIVPAHGTAHFTDDTTLEYTPYKGYCGPDTLTYIGKSHCGLDTGLVVIDVYCELYPKAVDDTEYICKNDIINISVLRNDTAYNGNTLHITGISNLLPDNLGQVTDVTSDLISFAANGQVGTVRFNYYSCDNGYISLCDTGSVVIFIQACPSPVVNIIYDTTFINTADTICAGGAVTSKTPWQITSLCNPPSGGSAVNNQGDTCFTYTPGNNFVGNDTFCIIICDNFACDTSKVIVTVLDTFIKAVPEACDVDTTSPDRPITIAVLANDLIPFAFDTTVTLISEPAQGTAVVNSDHSVTYTPTGKYIGDQTENFTYQVCIIDGSHVICDTADICVTVLGPCFIPDAFSPNGDGVNDLFEVPCTDKHPLASLRVFDRWGMEVWDSNGPYQNNWDGKNQQGTVLPDGTYYMLFYYNDGTGRTEAKFVVIHR